MGHFKMEFLPAAFTSRLAAGKPKERLQKSLIIGYQNQEIYPRNHW